MELLKQMYEVSAPSGKCKPMTDFVTQWVKENVPTATIDLDKKKNLYITKGTSDTYPVLCAHLDEVSRQRGKNYRVIVAGDVIFGYDVDKCETRGLGADDRNGIWVALQCLKKYDTIKCVFFVDEESGSQGSHECNMAFFDNARWVIQCDRRNSGDFIHNYGVVPLCSDEFIKDCDIKQFGYKKFDGTSTTDVRVLKTSGLKVSCANISCGYYNEHTDRETTKFSHLTACLSLVQYAIEHCTKVYPHEYEAPKPAANFNGRGWYGGDIEFDGFNQNSRNKQDDSKLFPIFEQYYDPEYGDEAAAMHEILIEVFTKYCNWFNVGDIYRSFARYREQCNA